MKALRNLTVLLATAASLAFLPTGAVGAEPADAEGSRGPEIGLTLRGVADNTVEQSEPVHIAVRLEAPEGLAQPMTLAPAIDTWADAITVEIVGAGGGAVVARAAAVGRPDVAQATIDRTHSAGGLWRIGGEVTAKIPPGMYVVRARLVIATGQGWTGTAESEEEPLRIMPPSGAPTRQGALVRARDALATGSLADAAGKLDAELTKHPGDIEFLMLRARVALLAGNAVGARLCMNCALRALPTGLAHQPPGLHELNREVTAAFEAIDPAGANPTPPAWSWPPAGVLTASPSSAVNANPPSGPAPALSAAPPVAPPPAFPLPSAAHTSVPPVAKSAPGNFAGVVISAAEFTDAKVIAEATGQWAASAIAGSQYGKTQYSAAQATGAPNISVAGNSPDAWCPANKTDGTDWLELTFAKSVHATEVRVRQNDAAGAVTKIEAIEPDGTAHVWWEGIDPYKAPAVREIVWFAVRVPKTPYLVARVKVTLNLASGPGYKEIDAVQLVGTEPGRD